MNYCVARDAMKADNKCREPCEPGYKYCERHKDRTKAVDEREEKALNDFAESVNPLMQQPQVIQDAEVVEDQKKELEKVQAATTIFDRVEDILNKTQQFANDAENNYLSLRPDEMRYYDKAGAEQLRSEVAVYERALDRQIRALTQVAKLNIEAQAVNINGVIRELIQQTVMRVFMRMGLNAEQTKQARILLAEEFAKLDKE